VFLGLQRALRCLANIKLSQHAVCADVPDTYENLYAFFIGRVRDRLHVILCFSPVGATFARRAQQVCDADCCPRAPTHGCDVNIHADQLFLSVMLALRGLPANGLADHAYCC